MSEAADHESRLSRIEAFLDAELRERQHLASLWQTYPDAPLNPWYGAAGGFPAPVGLGPAIHGAIRSASIPVGDVGRRVGIDQPDPVEAVRGELVVRLLETLGVLDGEKREDAGEPRWKVWELRLPDALHGDLPQRVAVLPAIASNEPAPIAGVDQGAGGQHRPAQVEQVASAPVIVLVVNHGSFRLANEDGRVVAELAPASQPEAAA